MKCLRSLFTKRKQSFSTALTAEERKRGRRLFERFFTLNGISVACLMNHVLVLYAIRNGLDDAMVAVMASFVHLTMPFMVLGKPIISSIGAARLRGLGWFLRYIMASTLILAPIIRPYASQTGVSGIILSGAFGFAFFRTLGMAAHTPLLGEVSERNERGSFLSRVQMRNEITYLFTMVIIIVLLRYLDKLWTYQIIIATGCLVGCYASAVIASVPESTGPLESARKPFSGILLNVWRNDSRRRLMFAWCAGLVADVIVIPFMIIAVKNGYGISDFAALGFALILVLGGVASGFVNRKISDLFGARTLLISFSIGLMIVAIFWSLAPSSFSPVPLGALFFLAGFCKIGLMIGRNQYFLETIPAADRVGHALIMRIASGAAAGLAVSVGGGGLLRLLANAGLEGLDVYRRYFLIILGVLLMLLIVQSRLKSDKSTPSKNFSRGAAGKV